MFDYFFTGVSTGATTAGVAVFFTVLEVWLFFFTCAAFLSPSPGGCGPGPTLPLPFFSAFEVLCCAALTPGATLSEAGAEAFFAGATAFAACTGRHIAASVPISSHGLRLQDRRHFFAYAAKVMRNFILDDARAYFAESRGGAAEHLTLGADEAMQVVDKSASDELLRVDAALLELEAIDPQLAELVEMRYFGGYTEVEVADLLGITDRTVRRRWDKARAWLFVALAEKTPESCGVSRCEQ